MSSTQLGIVAPSEFAHSAALLTAELSKSPEQYELLVGREKSLNVGRSFLIRVLLEIEQREELLRKEMVRRLALQPVDQEKEKVKK